MSNNLRIGAVILAAGSSRRMGRNKALLPVEGQPMIARVVQTFHDARIDPIVVVTGHEADAIRRAVTNVEFAHNPGYATRGMLTSIKIGINALLSSHAGSERTREEPDPFARVDAFFLALLDQPFIKPSTIDRLIRTWTDLRADVLRPTHANTHGHPLLIDARCIDAILALRDDDQTLNDFVRANSTNAVDVPVEDSATIQDIDTPADYDAALKRREPGN